MSLLLLHMVLSRLSMNYAYKTYILSPKGLHVTGDDQSDKLADSLEKKSNELGKQGWRLVSVTPTLNSGGSVSKLLLTFCKRIEEVDQKKD